MCYFYSARVCNGAVKQIKSTAACCVIAQLHLLAWVALRCLTHN